MAPVKPSTRLYKNGIIANNVHLVVKFVEDNHYSFFIIRNWLTDEKDVGMIFSDKTTVFATMKDVIDSRDSIQCRKMLGLPNNVDMALICTVTMCNAYVNDDEVINSWVASDMVNSSIRISLNFGLTEELRKITVGTICAILNPDVKEQITQCGLKCIGIKQPNDLLIIGELDGLKLCKGVTSRGTSCKNMVYVHNQGEYCRFHIKCARDTNRSAVKKKKISVNNNFISSILSPHDEYNDQNTTFSFNGSTSVAKPKETLEKLSDLGELVQKVMDKRDPGNKLIVVNKPKTDMPKKSDADNCRDFEKLAGIIRDYSSSDSKDYKKILGSLQLIHRRINGITQELITKSDILKSCSRLLDHPIETIAIGSLKLRRALKRYMKNFSKLSDISTPTFTAINKRKMSSKQKMSEIM